MARRLALFACLIAAAAVVLAAAGEAGARSSAKRNLWATVNICDTSAHPDDLGVRARAPGNGKRQRIWMLFKAQLRIGGRWKTTTTSSWKRVGSARYTYQESGYTFDLDVSSEPTADYLMRGLVRVEWRRHGRVVKHRRLVTAGHHPSVGADPKGYSRARCHIRGTLAD